MSSAGALGAIRWEAWSHRQIYEATHTPAHGMALNLDTTIALWWEIVGDLGEVRTRYQNAVDRLTAVNAGPNAEEAGATSLLVTRGLTEAQELAGLAGAKRARLNELNEHLRREMPEPGVPVEEYSPFLDQGLGWLTPPEFHRAETGRLNAEERARDLMRGYETAIAPDALTANAHNSADNPAHHDHTGDEPTIPLSGRLTGGTSDTGPVSIAGCSSGDGAEPPVDGESPGRFGVVGRQPTPHWAYGEFGPEGHVSLGDGPDTDTSDDEQTSRAAGGAIPSWRDEGDRPVGPRRGSDNLFGTDFTVPPGVIGE
jgi:hypothetical protein